MTGYDVSHAEGFIRLFGLPLAVAARRGSPSPTEDPAPAPAGAREDRHGR